MYEKTLRKTKQFIEKEKITQKEFSDMCGVSESTLSRFLQGGEVTKKTVRLIDRFVNGNHLFKVDLSNPESMISFANALASREAEIDEKISELEAELDRLRKYKKTFALIRGNDTEEEQPPEMLSLDLDSEGDTSSDAERIQDSDIPL